MGSSESAVFGLYKITVHGRRDVLSFWVGNAAETLAMAGAGQVLAESVGDVAGHVTFDVQSASGGSAAMVKPEGMSWRQVVRTTAERVYFSQTLSSTPPRASKVQIDSLVHLLSRSTPGPTITTNKSRHCLLNRWQIHPKAKCTAS